MCLENVHKSIYDITPFTTLDYPNKLACIVWFSGCNMRCKYCYNTEIVNGIGKISNDELLFFLKSRVSKLNGVVFSGGECTLNEDFIFLAKEVKRLGFFLKVDTNGSNQNLLKKCIESSLIDYIALDFKATKEKYKFITNSNLYDNFLQTLRFLLSINFDFEVRTTVHTDLLNEFDISEMANLLESEGYNETYFLQNFLQTNENFGNLPNQKNKINIHNIKSNLNITLRNP